MSIFVRWAELIITQDSVQFAEVCTKLLNAGIPYKERVQHMGHSNRRTGLIGSLGENAMYSTMYYLYVKKADLEKAQVIAFRK